MEGTDTGAVDTGATTAPEAAPAATPEPAEGAQPAVTGQQVQPQDSGAPAQADTDWSFDADAFKDSGISPQFIDGYQALAKEFGLTKDNAAALLTKANTLMNEMDVRAVENQAAEWIASAKNDPEFGGSALDANLAIAKKGLDAFGGEPLKQLLETTGLGNNPEIIRFFWKVGQAVSEDSFVHRPTGSRPATDEEKLQKIYPMMFAQKAAQG